MSKADQLVLDRRLRPIYDALDNQKPKKALQEAEKILKKHPNTTCAKVLKALALIRSERLTDAWAILDALDVAGIRHDEPTLNAFVHCYKDADVPERINLLYERAVDVEPSENHLTQLFMSYVRTKMYKNQQTVALRLYKECGNSPYYFWAVMSVVMQALESPALAEKMLYPLADKMCLTHIQKNGYSAGAEVEIHAVVLEGMKKYEEAYQLLTSPQALALPMTQMFVNQKRVDLLVNAGRNAAARLLALKEIEDCNDNWHMWCRLFDAALNMMTEATKEGRMGDAKDLMNELVALIDKECGGEGKETKNRGPYLARLELIKRLANAEMPIREALGEPVELIASFVRRFYDKPVCFADVNMYLCLLNEEQKTMLNDLLTCFIGDLVQKNEAPEDPHESKVNAIVVYERIRRITNSWAKESNEMKRQHLQQIIAQIAQPGRSDPTMGALTHLAVSMLWDEWRQNDDYNKFYEMLLLLEYVCSKNASDPLCKLILLRAYSHIGNTVRILALNKVLDIKSVQVESLGHFYFPTHELAGRFNMAIIANTQLSVMYEQAEKEIMECLLSAYKNGKFNQIPRLIHLSSTMKKSTQAVSCDVLNRYLSSLFVIEDLDEAITTMYGDEETIDWNSLNDNRDLTVIPNLEPGEYEKLLADMKNKTHCEFADISRLRDVLCRALSSIGRITRRGVEKTRARNDLRESVSLFKAHLEYCSREYPSFSIPSRLMQSPAPMRLSQWVHSGGLQVLLRFAQVAVDVVPILDNGKIPSESLLGTKGDLDEELTRIVNVFSRDLKPTQFFYTFEAIVAASRALQTLAALQIVLKLLRRLVVRRASNEATDGNKSSGDKKKIVKTLTNSFSEKTPFALHCDVLLQSVNEAAEKLDMRLRELGDALKEDGVLPEAPAEDFGQARIVLLCAREKVDTFVLRSYMLSVDDMQTTVRLRFSL